MKIIAAAITTASGFAAVAYLAAQRGNDANGQIFAILVVTLITSLALIGSASRNNTDDDQPE